MKQTFICHGADKLLKQPHHCHRALRLEKIWEGGYVVDLVNLDSNLLGMLRGEVLVRRIIYLRVGVFFRRISDL